VLDTAVTQLAVNGALQAQGVDPAQLRAATAGATVTVDALNPPNPDSGQRTALALVSVGLLYFQLLIFGLAVATGVVEEKTSRVVELLLSTVTPLMGKVAGIGVIGLLQLAAYGVVGLGAAAATGVITITGTAVAVFVGTLGWFVLGYAFFAMLYAAAGSMVSRQEEVGSTTTPLTLLVIAMFFLAQTSVQDPSGTLPSVMAWIPPFSAILMPLRIAAGVASPVQGIGDRGGPNAPPPCRRSAVGDAGNRRRRRGSNRPILVAIDVADPHHLAPVEGIPRFDIAETT